MRIEYKKPRNNFYHIYLFFIHTERLLKNLTVFKSWNQLAECKLWIFILCILKSLGYPGIRECSHKLLTHLEKKNKSKLIEIYAIFKNIWTVMSSGSQDILLSLQTNQESQLPDSFYLYTTSELECYTLGALKTAFTRRNTHGITV